MAVRCRRCGLEYDVALFSFGRTIDCNCGERVGCDALLAHVAPTEHPRFFADAMLTGLARWLRMLGYDTASEPAAGDAAVVRRCYEEDRALLTRDRKLVASWRVPRIHLVTAERALAQLEEVARAFDLRVDEERMFTRCSRCNVRLIAAEPEGEAVAAARRSAGPVRQCPSCRRYYWEGSHVERMRRELAARVAARP